MTANGGYIGGDQGCEHVSEGKKVFRQFALLFLSVWFILVFKRGSGLSASQGVPPNTCLGVGATEFMHWAAGLPGTSAKEAQPRKVRLLEAVPLSPHYVFN